MKRQRLIQLARERMKSDAGTYYDDREPPELEMLDAAHFLAHRYVYNFAQSGSDWADHYILRGTVNGETIELEPFYVHLTELEADDYRQDEILELVRNGDVEGARAAIKRMNAATAERVRAHNARIEAEDRARKASMGPEPTARCPKCRSTDAGIVDMIFENLTMRCNACGFEDHITTDDRDTWAP